MEKFGIIEIKGGIGKNIAATAVCAAIKKKYDNRKLIVISPYPAVFLNNPNIYRVYSLGNTPYFYENYIKEKNTIFFCEEPYLSKSFLDQKKHIIESWCETIDVTYNGESPKLYINDREDQLLVNSINLPKPILVIQPFGGANKDLPYCWNRDLPPVQAQEIVDILSKDYSIIQICDNSQIKLAGCQYYTANNFREIFSLLNISKKRLFIDSFGQHAASALKLSSTVCWITNSPNVFGYDLHKNILSKDGEKFSHLTDSYFHKYNSFGERFHDYPFEDEKIFNITEIVESIQENDE